MSIITIVALLAFLAFPEGISQEAIQRCRCINKESRPMGKRIDTVEVIPASSHCSDTEIIATLKKDGQKVCLDPDAGWVKKVLERKSSKNTT